MPWHAFRRRSKLLWLRRLLLVSSAGATGLALAIAAGVADSSPIAITSLESKTVDGTPVVNRIRWQPGLDEDRWIMQQSHKGPDASPDDWDRIGISVDRDGKTKFFQWEPGEMEWGTVTTQAALKATCFMCHPNGPRAIRPDLAGAGVGVSLWSQWRLALWNLRIKSYGKLESADNPKGFRVEGRLANAELDVPTCRKCHAESGFFVRGTLTRQNYMAIDFMVEQGFMPPPPFKLSEAERLEVRRFVGKF